MKKLITTAIVLLSVGLAMVLVGGILQGVDWASTGTYDGSFLAIALNNIGYIVATLSGIVLIAVGVASSIKCDKCDKEEKSDKK